MISGLEKVLNKSGQNHRDSSGSAKQQQQQPHQQQPLQHKSSLSYSYWSACKAAFFPLSLLALSIHSSSLWHIESIKQSSSVASVTTKTTITIAPSESKNENTNHPFNQTSKETSYAEEYTKPSLEVVWLMSFPNSGTSYTLLNLERSTNTTTATNYGDEVQEFPQYRLFHPHQGPFVHRTSLSFPPHRILTKTHCHVSLDGAEFLRGCQMTSWHERHDPNHPQNDGPYHQVPYNIRTGVYQHTNDTQAVPIGGTVHLIRNPLDNLVSRMHLGVRQAMRKHNWTQAHADFYLGLQSNITLQENKNTTAEVQAATEGFTAWCRDHVDAKAGSRLPADVRDYLSDIPCYTDLLYYIHWHNMVCRVTNVLSGGTDATRTNKYNNILPFVHVLYYEDYMDRFQETLTELTGFLEVQLQPHAEPIPFKDGKTYDDYYTSHQRDRIAQIVNTLSTSDAWTLLERYFEDYDFTKEEPTNEIDEDKNFHSRLTRLVRGR